MTAAQPSSASAGARQHRRGRGDFPTPDALVRRIVAAVMPAIAAGQRLTVLDPACGDGRFLAAAADHISAAGGNPDLHGVDVDAAMVATAAAALAARGDVRLEVGDALTRDWGGHVYDVVLANPPYLSQLAAATTRGGSSVRGGGPYADAAAEFLVLAISLAQPNDGRVGIVLPQSILGSRDAASVRAHVEDMAAPIWSWWSPKLHFDAAVFVCAMGFRRNGGNQRRAASDRHPVWTGVVTSAMGVPDLPSTAGAGTFGDHAVVTANFRDEYYGLIPAVGDHRRGPQFVTSGAIDVARCRWGERPVTFNRRRFRRPRVDLDRLDERMRRWAQRLAVPKVLIANQTRVVECVVDRRGSMLPAVPVLTARPSAPADTTLSALAAVLSSPFVSAWLWHAAAGTGLSARTFRLRPALVADVPWPAGDLDGAIRAYDAGDLAGSAAAVHRAYSIGDSAANCLLHWWTAWSSRERAA